MSKNITILGANYSNVPAVRLPQTGGGTARFDDCTVVTATAGDVASGKVFVASDGTITTGTASGGGGVDCPTFTMTYDSSWSEVQSVTCDKTFNECVEYINNGCEYAFGVMTAVGTEEQYLGALTLSVVSGAKCVYSWINASSGFDIEYNSNGTVNYVAQTWQITTLETSSNGHYEDSRGRLYSSVDVSVPQPSGSISITTNGTHNVTNYASAVVNVSGSSLNAQSAQSTTRSTSTSYTEVISLTCEASGTYDVYWSTFRSNTSGTWGSQLYLGNSAYGTAQTGSWSNHIQNIHLQNVQVDANEEVSVRVRSRGSSYYGYVGTLTIIQTS